MDIINPYRFATSEQAFDGFGNASRSFDGASHYLDLGDSDDFSFGDGSNDSPFSVSAWVKIDTLPNFRIISKYDTNADTEWSFGTDGQGRLLGLVADGLNLRAQRYSNFTDNNGDWQHVVCTYDGRGGSSAEVGLKLYLDGIEVQNTTYASGTYVAMSNTTQPLNIGRIQLASVTQYADGNIADVRIYDAELSASDVSELYAGTNVTTNLVGHWIKDTPSLLDHAGNNDATNYGSKFSYDNPSPAVEFGSMSRLFDGTNDYVDLGDSDDFSFDNVTNDSPFSISVWFKSNLSVGNIQTLLAKAQSNSKVEYLLNLNSSGTVVLVLHEASASFGSYITAQSTSSYTPNEWIHAVVTYDGSLSSNGINVYINGVNDTGVRNSAGTYNGQTNTTAPFLIGNRLSSSGQEMSGNMADARIYDAELTSTDVSDIYNGTNVTTNLVGHWLTNNDDVLDYAGVNDGTNNGSTYSYDNPNALVEYGGASRGYNGGGNYTDLGNDTSLDITDKIGISVWVRPDTARNSTILGKWKTGAGDDNSYTLYMGQDQGNTKITFFLQPSLGVGRSAVRCDGNISLSTTEWSHIACSFDGSTMKLYVNGVLDNSVSFTDTIKVTTNKLFIGKLRNHDNIYTFDGNIADVRLYDSDLTSTEAYELYKGVDHRTNLIGQWLTNSDDVEDKVGTNDGSNNGSTYSTDSPL